MKFLLASLTAASCMMLAGAAHADLTLATAKGCMNCHDVGAKKVGPSFKDIAKKYTAKDTDKLAKKVLEGGSGVWGAVPMSPNKLTGVTEADAKKLVTWILTQK